MEDSPDSRVQIKYSHSGFLCNSHETPKNSRGLGAKGSFSVCLPTHYQWWVGKKKSEILNEKEKKSIYFCEDVEKQTKP